MTQLLRYFLRSPARSLATVIVLFVLAPAMVMAATGVLVPPVLRGWHWLIATSFLITSLAIAIEALAAARRVHAPLRPVTPPSLSVLVAAYLPNEQDIIIETLRHVLRTLRVPSHRLQIVLAYNSPTALDLEEVLRQIGETSAQILPLKVHGSRSKAENIVAALPSLTGEMTVLLDADHHPAGDAPARAWRWLEQGYDIVQGRCVVRNGADSTLTRLVAIEFEQMYGVSHQGRSMLADTAIFGGTNGWWRTSVLRKIGMDRRMLTEDIESAVRSIRAGHRLVHDRSVISTELATHTWRPWWNQRLRWAQGWLQVALRHQGALRRTPHLDKRQRLYWWYMLTWGALFPIFATAALSVLIADLAAGDGVKALTDPYLVLATGATLVVQVLLTHVTWRVASPAGRAVGRRWHVFYLLLSPLYVMLKNAVAITALLREVAALDEWVVTARPTARTQVAAQARA
ncbi:MAG TPA: glycosyltransferase family 2 protein [Solirubrobacteraceae bacterium]|nr:glycosyltransferase family 2 protein [Solirubrobacteraceae bacterium]